MILVPMTAAEFHEKTELLRLQGVVIAGPVGKISRDGVTAGYTHANETLTIHIIEKPIFLSRAYCERRIEDWLSR